MPPRLLPLNTQAVAYPVVLLHRQGGMPSVRMAIDGALNTSTIPGRLIMEKTSAELVFKWLEEVWSEEDETTADCWPNVSYAVSESGGAMPLSPEEFHRAHRNLKEGLSDIRLDFESMAISGDRVTCAIMVKARNRFSGEPIAFRSKVDGCIRDGQLVSAANAIDYLQVE
jgi:hypothetical protein